MNPFTYSYLVKVYFGEKAVAKNPAAELANFGPNVMLAYGGASIKKNGFYDELIGKISVKDFSTDALPTTFPMKVFLKERSTKKDRSGICSDPPVDSQGSGEYVTISWDQ